MNKPYHERPDWILKSIVYFCDNYTIDGKSLRKYKRGAIKDYLGSSRGGANIDYRLLWDNTDAGFDFWAYLWYLHTGQCFKADHDANCHPWTDYEKRKIVKMPRVK
jgi:hypothetical protein